jgi:hypothetical protein
VGHQTYNEGYKKVLESNKKENKTYWKLWDKEMLEILNK